MKGVRTNLLVAGTTFPSRREARSHFRQSRPSPSSVFWVLHLHQRGTKYQGLRLTGFTPHGVIEVLDFRFDGLYFRFEILKFRSEIVKSSSDFGGICARLSEQDDCTKGCYANIAGGLLRKPVFQLLIK